MVIYRSILAVLLSGLALFVAPSVYAAPAVDCGAPVIDETTDQLFDVNRLGIATKDMSNRTGLDVYVRAFQTTPHGDAGVWWRDAYKACPSWLATDGITPKPNVLVVVIGMDRRSAIEYGSAVHKLDGDIDRIRGRVLGDALRDANSSSDKREAFTAAVEKTLAELEAAYTKPPFDWGNVWAWVLKVVLAIAGLVGAVFSAFLTRTGIRKHRDKVRVRAEMVEARNASTDAVVNAEATLRQHFIEADSAMEGVEGEFIVLPSRESVTERINAASASHFERAGDPVPKDIDGLTAARDAYTSYAASIAAALRDASKRTDDIRKRAEQCTDEAKDRDLRAAVDFGSRKLRELNDTPKWLDTTTHEAILADALRTADSLVGTSPARAVVDTAISAVSSAYTGVDLVRTAAKSAEKDVAKVTDDIAAKRAVYRDAVPADVSKKTAAKTLSSLETLLPKAESLRAEVSRGEQRLTPEGITSQVSELRRELERALTGANAEIAAAQRRRDEERRKREEAERAARRKREEEAEEERRRSYNSGFGGGFGAGYSSGGGFSSGGGGDFGGGSSGGW